MFKECGCGCLADLLRSFFMYYLWPFVIARSHDYLLYNVIASENLTTDRMTLGSLVHKRRAMGLCYRNGDFPIYYDDDYEQAGC